MKSENGRFIGLGVALVDHKYTGYINFPQSRGELLAFIDKNKPDLVRAGGPIPNAFTTISLFDDIKLRLFYSVGADQRGEFFQEKTTKKIGHAQIYPSEPTGVWVGFNDEKGKLEYGISYYGAGLKVKIPNKELREETNYAFLTDISSTKNEELNEQAESILNQVNKDGGIFVLSLGGSRPSSVSIESINSVLTSFRIKPHIIFSNFEEFKYVTRSEDLQRLIITAFPYSRLLVTTLGKEGSLIRFEGEIIKIPSLPVKNVVDEVGAGDAYMGTLLAHLFKEPYKLWTGQLVKKAASIATHAASQVVTSASVRLQHKQVKTTLNYAKRYK